MPGEWLSLSEVAQELGVHPSTIRSWADQGRLPVHRTQGGHRRFRASEVALCLVSQQAAETTDMNKVIQSALRQVRVQISEGHLAGEKWYAKLDSEAREQYRRSGRALLQGLIGYLTASESEGMVDARALGYEYASRGHRRGLSSSEAIQAFLFFRTMLFDAMLNVYQEAGVRSAGVWANMFRRSNAFTDQIMITLLETYEGYQRSNARQGRESNETGE